jgi:hypothetical protein
MACSHVAGLILILRFTWAVSLMDTRDFFSYFAVVVISCLSCSFVQFTRQEAVNRVLWEAQCVPPPLGVYGGQWSLNVDVNSWRGTPGRTPGVNAVVRMVEVRRAAPETPGGRNPGPVYVVY